MRFWTIVGAVAALIAVAFAGYVFYSQQSENSKHLEVQLIARSRLVDSNVSGSAQDVELQYKGRKIANYELLQLRVINVGGQPIRSGDYETPVQLVLTNVAEVLSVQEPSSDPPGLGANPQVNGNTITISPLLMNPSDSFTLAVGVVPDANKTPAIQVDGRIVGVKNIGFRDTIGTTVTKGPLLGLWEKIEPFFTFVGVIFVLILMAAIIDSIGKVTRGEMPQLANKERPEPASTHNKATTT